MTELRPVTLITGASAGIGTALARVFARHGHDLLLVARREQRLAQLADEIAAEGHRRPLLLALDLRQRDAVARIIETMSGLGVEADNVVNNAGFGLIGPVAALSRDEQLAMVDLNIRALTDLSLAFLGSLERRRGGILNVASIAGFMPGPHMASYHATKAHNLSFTEALHWELKPRGIRVTALCPGPVPTEFQERAGFASAYPGILTLSAEAVAEAGYRGLKRGRRVVIPGLANKLAVAMVRMLPRAMVLNSVGRYTRKRGRQR
jgi:short-subunit dehydrogenase